jgi:TIGR03009 family protein
MRYAAFVLAGVLAGATAVRAQNQYQQPYTPPPAQAVPALDPAHNRLDALLLRWEQELNKIQNLEAQVVRTDKDRTFGQVVVLKGVAKYKKPNLGLLQLVKVGGKPEEFEKFICTGTYLFQYSPATKIIWVHELPRPKPGQVADANFMALIFGMRAADAKARYNLQLTKEDENWIYIQVTPTRAEDKADFQRAQLVLNAKTFLPRRLWFEGVNQNEQTWDLPAVNTNAQIDAREFAAPEAPPGWRKEMARQPNAAAPGGDLRPRVVRPKQP